MFVFGHLGIGSGAVLALRRDLPLQGVMTGTLAPDLLDKPLYYGLVRTGFLPASMQAALPGTRTFGHTLLAVALVALLALGARHRRAWVVAVALGMLSHDALDFASDWFASAHTKVPFTLATSGAFRAAVYPLAGPFCRSYTVDLAEHLRAVLRLHAGTELLGLAALAFVARKLPGKRFERAERRTEATP